MLYTRLAAIFTSHLTIVNAFLSAGNSSALARDAGGASCPVSRRPHELCNLQPRALRFASRSLFSRRSFLPAVTSIGQEWPSMRQLSVHCVPFQLNNDVTVLPSRPLVARSRPRNSRALQGSMKFSCQRCTPLPAISELDVLLRATVCGGS